MSALFFVRSADPPAAAEEALAEEMCWRTWRPREDAVLAMPALDPLRLAAKLQDWLGLFENSRYTELGLWRGTTRVHRLIVTPRWYRFPFMASGDLQVGALWTHPAWRRRGLARVAIQRAHRMFAAPGQRFWYVAESSNGASLALARSTGYRLTGEGRRTRPAGVALLGRFEIESYCA